MPGAGDDSPGLGILWFLVFVAEASLLIPLSLGIAAEVIERRAQLRRFQWPRVFLRFLLPPPIVVGSLCTAVWIMPYIQSRRPTHWVEKDIFLFCLSGVFT
jgi:hypothetical protein